MIAPFQDLVGDPLEAEVDLEDDEEEDQLGVDPPEDQFTVLTSRNRGNRSSNMSSNSDSSENSGLLRSDKVTLIVYNKFRICFNGSIFCCMVCIYVW